MKPEKPPSSAPMITSLGKWCPPSTRANAVSAVSATPPESITQASGDFGCLKKTVVVSAVVADATTTATEAGTAVQTAQATVTQATTTEKTAADEAAQLKAAADKAVAEAQPTPEQQKTLQDAQNDVQAAQQQLAGLKAALEKLQAIQAPPAAPAAP